MILLTKSWQAISIILLLLCIMSYMNGQTLLAYSSWMMAVNVVMYSWLWINTEEPDF